MTAKVEPLTVTVCDACFTESCWKGEFYCESHRIAGTIDVPNDLISAISRRLTFPTVFAYESVCRLLAEVRAENAELRATVAAREDSADAATA